MPKKPEGSAGSTFHGARSQQYDYDGITVSDALSYYFPEWKHNNGRRVDLARGTTNDGFEFFIAIPISRALITRVEWQDKDGKHRVSKHIYIDDPKEKLLSLFREGDSHGESTDKRYLMMVDDMNKRYG